MLFPLKNSLLRKEINHEASLKQLECLSKPFFNKPFAKVDHVISFHLTQKQCVLGNILAGIQRAHKNS